MAEHRPLVLDNGEIKQIPSGDTFTSDLTGSGGGVYDIRFGFSDTPISNQIIDTYPIVRQFTLPQNLSGIIGKVYVNPTANYTMLLQVNDSTVSTITIDTSGSISATNSETVVTSGSILTLVAPTTVDTTIENVVLVIPGELS